MPGDERSAMTTLDVNLLMEQMTEGAAQALSFNMASAFDILSFGMLLGLDVNVAKYVTFNVEGRFIGETAITTGATVKF